MDKSLFSGPDAKSFFSEVGAGRSSRLSRILYIALHESEQIEVGGVAESLEHYNSLFQFWGIEERMLQYCKKLHFTFNLLQKN